MPLPSINGVARLTADPELRFTQGGKAVASISLAFNSRRQNPQTQQWEDGDTFYVRSTAWERLAENIAETLTKGMEVLVSGELRTESWEKDGQKNQRPALLIRSIGPNLAYATAQVTKATTTGDGQRTQQRPQQAHQPRQQPQRPADDPWAVNPADIPF